MKLLKTFSTLFFLSILFSCSDACDDVDCGVGTCDDGTCMCPDGYSGTNCEIFDACFNVDCGPGTCVDGTCDCPDGFSGENCEIEDLCFNNQCVNGDCDPNTGDCNCDEFYEGTNCDVEEREKFFGTWGIDDITCVGSVNLNTNFILAAGPTIEDISIQIPGGIGFMMNATISGSTMTIPAQDIDVGGGNFANFSGTGEIDGDVINLNMQIIFDGLTSNCSGPMPRL